MRYTGSGEREFYDLTNDPYELHNDPSLAPAALDSQLDALVACTGAEECQKVAR